VRYEYNGDVTVIADSFQGKPLNSPNDVVVHPDGSIWFTDPPSGIRGDYEGIAGSSELHFSVYGRRHVELTLPGTDTVTGADGIRCDIEGNIWAGARPGVQVIAPDGHTIGLIRLPEVCANVCFCGVRHNLLFMTASQSLYSVYIGTQGAGIA